MAAPSDGGSGGKGSSKSSSKLVPAILLPLLTVAVLGLSIAFFFKRRRTNVGHGVWGGCVGGGERKFLHPKRASLFARDKFGGSGRGAPTTTAASTAPTSPSTIRGSGPSSARARTADERHGEHHHGRADLLPLGWGWWWRRATARGPR
ncbi:formin-like protein 1 [Hordeum vulgare]|nr:formin-like protein 1 [Hordeum vulgare]